MPWSPVALTVTTPGSCVGMSRQSCGSIVRGTGVPSSGLVSSTIAFDARSWFELPAEATLSTPLRSAYLVARPRASTSAFWSSSALQL